MAWASERMEMTQAATTTKNRSVCARVPHERTIAFAYCRAERSLPQRRYASDKATTTADIPRCLVGGVDEGWLVGMDRKEGGVQHPAARARFSLPAQHCSSWRMAPLLTSNTNATRHNRGEGGRCPPHQNSGAGLSGSGAAAHGAHGVATVRACHTRAEWYSRGASRP